LAHRAKVADELLAETVESRAHHTGGVSRRPDRRVGTHEIRTRLLDRHAGLQPAEPLVAVALSLLVWIAVERYPELRMPGKVRLTRQHADDRVGPAVDAQWLADDVARPGEPRLPQPVADYHDTRWRRAVLFLREGPPEDRTDA